MPGDNDKTSPDGYQFLQLVNLYHNGLTMSVVLETQYGTASGDYYENWTRGPGSPTKVTEISGMRVAQLWGTMPNEGESVGEAVRRAVYEYLINSGEVDGEIANNPPLPPAQMEEAAAADNAPTPEQAPAEQPAEGDAAPAPSDAPAPEETPSEAPADEVAVSEDAPKEDAP